MDIVIFGHVLGWKRTTAILLALVALTILWNLIPWKTAIHFSVKTRLSRVRPGGRQYGLRILRATAAIP